MDLLFKLVKAILLKGRKTWMQRGLDPDLPLFQNIERLGRLVVLNDVEKAIMVFVVALNEFSAFEDALSNHYMRLNDMGMFRALSTVTGYAVEDIQKALRRDGTLRASGLIELEHEERLLHRKLNLVRELKGLILNPMINDDELSNRVVYRASAGTLGLEAYPHLKKDSDLLLRYLQGAISKQRLGVNVLIYGPPGTGKTEYAKALIEALGWRLFEIAHADMDGDPLNPRLRLQSLIFSQRTLRHKENSALLFDEVEDVFPGASTSLARLFNSRGHEHTNPFNAKAWVNRALEENGVPTIWITNDADIDLAYLRRFDYSVELNVPPHSVRHQIARQHLGEQVSDEACLTALAEIEDLLPAQLERAAKVVELAELPEASRWAGIVQTLQRSRALLGQKHQLISTSQALPYRLDYLNADTDLHTLTQGFSLSGKGSVCLYGPPGTGKSAYGKSLAQALNKPLLIRRASDLMSKWVGENEQNIAQAFYQAEQEGAILLLDEVDSFLQDRQHARAQWETTLVNEMLTQMESYQGIFIATTNLMDNLDAASLRRFDLKVRLNYLKSAQGVELLRDYCQWLELTVPSVEDERIVSQIHNLTPGDFAAVCRQHVLRQLSSANDLVQALLTESALKQDGQRAALGFV